jgi:hypothetical protein
MMLILLTTMGIAFAGEARHELSLEVGTQAERDSDAGFLSGDPEGSLGIRGGYGMSSWLTILGSLHVGGTRTIMEDYSYYDYGYEDEYYDEYHYTDSQVFDSLFLHTQISSGPKASYVLKPWLVPYATVQATGVHGLLRLDDDLDEKDSLIETSAQAIAVGGAAAAGIEIRSKSVRGEFNVASHLELGYGATTKLNFKSRSGTEGGDPLSIGDLAFGGTYFRLGIGLRF